MPKFYEEGLDPEELKVQISELLIATSEMSDELVHSAVPEVLKLLLKQLQMDVVFVSEFIEGRRYFRQIESASNNCPIAVGDSDELERTFCQRIVDGRMPPIIGDVSKLPPQMDIPAVSLKIGAHLSTPIALSDGSIYGTLCCFSETANNHLDNRDLKNLQLAAQYIARRLEQNSHKS